MWSEYELIEASRLATRQNHKYGTFGLDVAAAFLETQAVWLSYFPLSKAFREASTQTAQRLRAVSKLSDHMTKRHKDKPEFNIKTTYLNGRTVLVDETTVSDKPYYELKRFKKDMPRRKDPKLLIVSPMSGHYASLLKSTVEAMLPNHDVYIVDWKNPRDVDVSENGIFDFEKYMDCVLETINTLGPDVHLMGISQSTVPLLAATGVLAQKNSKNQPVSLTLIGGPVDTRKSKTSLHDFAEKTSFNWFSQNVIGKVPSWFKGKGRKVYPGYTQLMALMQHGKNKHLDKLSQLNIALKEKDCCTAEELNGFYKEYFAVMDLDQSFFFDTLRHVYKDHSLANGTMTYKGKTIDLSKIKKTKLLTIEGGKDQICLPGETKAAHDLCSNLDSEKKTHITFSEFGHYGIAIGSRFKQNVAPKITKFIRSGMDRKYAPIARAQSGRCPHNGPARK